MFVEYANVLTGGKGILSLDSISFSNPVVWLLAIVFVGIVAFTLKK